MFSSGLIPLWLALQRKGWCLCERPIKDASDEIMWSLPHLIGNPPDAIADAMKELGVTNCGCGTF
ncbi:hypothetical protein SISSUDRAFT_1052672 [Sistotremastrum suecicum HHB10207 ss-3]|uniref:Uncharacterized protein n=1 Tax=Sistotremastrum suecicum HHB10207 ss-3 TaxID=1314776 RepID=A0A165ZQ76_9AGAM|nr:hypothetical protein SISSUDRAFT_1052672 [Sistotremastrum suecicum HHB10207 ss-3]